MKYNIQCIHLVLGQHNVRAKSTEEEYLDYTQGCNGAEVQGCRGAGVQGCRGAGVQGCRGAGVQGCRGAGVQTFSVS